MIGLEDLLSGLEKHWQENKDDLNRGRLYAQELMKHYTKLTSRPLDTSIPDEAEEFRAEIRRVVREQAGVAGDRVDWTKLEILLNWEALS